jgi:hypothetical protein
VLAIQYRADCIGHQQTLAELAELRTRLDSIIARITPEE